MELPPSASPASEGISSPIAELHSMCSLGSRWRLIDQMTIDSSKTTPPLRKWSSSLFYEPNAAEQVIEH